MSRSFCLLLVMVVTVSHVQANVFSDVLSWVGLGGSEKEEEAADDLGSADLAGEDVEPGLGQDNESSDDIVEVEAENNDDTEEEAPTAPTPTEPTPRVDEL
eukprot:GFUD01009354.1.p2 GENE.GFUD01009354.1~~GFUD01009354.1.p2  ORF type:complete len:111 (-),score=47.73 GFUD01009354.1:34-336(-)